jgi:hypothetical protein
VTEASRQHKQMPHKMAVAHLLCGKKAHSRLDYVKNFGLNIRSIEVKDEL